MGEGVVPYFLKLSCALFIHGDGQEAGLSRKDGFTATNGVGVEVVGQLDHVLPGVERPGGGVVVVNLGRVGGDFAAIEAATVAAGGLQITVVFVLKDHAIAVDIVNLVYPPAVGGHIDLCPGV